VQPPGSGVWLRVEHLPSIQEARVLSTADPPTPRSKFLHCPPLREDPGLCTSFLALGVGLAPMETIYRCG
jgi:hypothetical protein